MDNSDAKIKFYSLGSEKIELIKKNGNDNINYSKAVFSSSNFDNALLKVIEKDIDSLDIKINKIVNEIKRKLDEIGINNEVNISYGINEINKIITLIDKTLVDLLEYKNTNKVGVFSSDKKTKKQKLKQVEIAIEYLNKSKMEILSMKNEYIKLCDRKKTLVPTEDYELEEDYDENPLERTVNFYIKQKEEVKS